MPLIRPAAGADRAVGAPPLWLLGVLLVAILYLMYSPTFLVDYLMNDEWGSIGKPAGSIPERMLATFLILGRGLFGAYHELVFRFVGYDGFRAQIIRFASFASMAAIAWVALRFVDARSRRRYFALGVVLLLFSQRPFQITMACSLQCISNTQPSMWLSLLALGVLLAGRPTESAWTALIRPRALAVLALLMLAMQSTQTFALFALILLAYAALTDWPARRGDVVAFLVLSAAAIAVSWVVYLTGLGYLHSMGAEGYRLGESALAAQGRPLRTVLKAINPFSYWSTFAMWSNPFPFTDIRPLGIVKPVVASLIGLAWIGSAVAALAIEWRSEPSGRRSGIAWKWLAVVACLALAALYLLADSPQRIIEHRPHVTMTFVGVVVMSWAYALQVLWNRLAAGPRAMAACAGAALVLLSAWGAQADVLRGIVNNRMEQINFIRAEIANQRAAPYRNVFVVLPRWSGCITEPCSPMVGHVVGSEYHLTREGAYRYAIATIGGIPDNKEIVFVRELPEPLPPESVVVDWNRYVEPRRSQTSRFYNRSSR